MAVEIFWAVPGVEDEDFAGVEDFGAGAGMGFGAGVGSGVSMSWFPPPNINVIVLDDDILL